MLSFVAASVKTCLLGFFRNSALIRSLYFIILKQAIDDNEPVELNHRQLEWASRGARVGLPAAAC